MRSVSRMAHSAGAVALAATVVAGVAGPATAQPTTEYVTSAPTQGPFTGLGGGVEGAADSGPFAGLGGGMSGTATAAPSTSPTATASPAVPITSTTDKQMCPKVQILAVQGTGESSDSSSITADSGMLGQLVQPVMMKANAGGKPAVERAYIPYAADFGFKGVPYAESMTNGLGNLEAMTTSISTSCPDTKFVIAGYSQGADIADQFLRSVGQGKGPIDADQVAGGVLFSSPTRKAGSGLFPGADASSPAPVPGTSGDAVSKVDFGEQVAPEGGGISPTANTAGELGELTGRVASFCVAGDLACDTPEGAPIARLVANIAGQSDLRDPVAALTSIGTALANTAVKTTAEVVNNDVSGDRIDTLDYAPKKSISQRLADASDPRAPMPDVGKTLSKLATIGLNSVMVIAKKVLTPANIIQLATVGMANPPAALTLLGTKVLGAVGELITPATGDRLVQSAHKAVEQNVTDNKDLGKLITDTKYWDSIKLHGSYGSTPSTPTGESAVAAASKWIEAIVSDVAGSDSEYATPKVPLTTATVERTAASTTSGTTTTKTATSQASSSPASSTQPTTATTTTAAY